VLARAMRPPGAVKAGCGTTPQRRDREAIADYAGKPLGNPFPLLMVSAILPWVRQRKVAFAGMPMEAYFFLLIKERKARKG